MPWRVLVPCYISRERVAGEGERPAGMGNGMKRGRGPGRCRTWVVACSAHAAVRCQAAMHAPFCGLGHPWRGVQVPMCWRLAAEVQRQGDR